MLMLVERGWKIRTQAVGSIRPTMCIAIPSLSDQTGHCIFQLKMSYLSISRVVLKSLISPHRYSFRLRSRKWNGLKQILCGASASSVVLTVRLKCCVRRQSLARLDSSIDPRCRQSQAARVFLDNLSTQQIGQTLSISLEKVWRLSAQARAVCNSSQRLPRLQRP
ncbi:unannotated protein [freshwater metagenome]|uniref:Unannotated protein n=1 Tax=freshwater metagenome TaxID=449393 RepID=A0A6J6C8S3_9ZZZZ